MKTFIQLLPLYTFAFGIVWYFIRKIVERSASRRALAAALYAEINAMKTAYQKVELTTVYNNNNVQSLEENYTVIYDNAADRISLLDYEDVKTIVFFYTTLKAHIDTLRVLSRNQKEMYLAKTILDALDLKDRKSHIIESAEESYSSTYQFALESQNFIYG
ncbi:MAG: hypothetical protein VB133_10620 [Anaeromusa sp.]|uniref:hypothetical protein n=1 Tax=Anaeromusa sp. TaxID=1872520 RepID=UPI002B20D273|nr:hypothetical protein [Anaeromusa sp.]MEA4835574.1 hypothetical protein [Anaeromusa sp.]